MSCLITKNDAFSQTWSSSSTKSMRLITVTTVSSCLITAMTAGKRKKSIKFKKTDPYLCFLFAAEEKELCVMFLIETSKMADGKTSAWNINAA